MARMSNSPETPAERIAADLALAIHQGLIRPGERLPSQTRLMKSYEVAMGTAASALAKLAAAGLIRGEPGRGTFAMDPDRLFHRSPVLDVMAAASMCRRLAALSFGPDTDTPTLPVGGDPHWDDPHADPEKTLPPRQVDVSALVALDRHVLRWMSEAFFQAARRMVGAGQQDADTHLLAAARAILRDGGRRTQRQDGIAYYAGSPPEDEDVVLRIWPERGVPRDPDGPPF